MSRRTRTVIGVIAASAVLIIGVTGSAVATMGEYSGPGTFNEQLSDAWNYHDEEYHEGACWAYGYDPQAYYQALIVFDYIGEPPTEAEFKVTMEGLCTDAGHPVEYGVEDTSGVSEDAQQNPDNWESSGGGDPSDYDGDGFPDDGTAYSCIPPWDYTDSWTPEEEEIYYDCLDSME